MKFLTRRVHNVYGYISIRDKNESKEKRKEARKEKRTKAKNREREREETKVAFRALAITSEI